MTVVNTADVTESDVRASVRRVIDHAESIWDEWAWQVENRTWSVLGYQSWDEMRRGEYGALTSVSAPRAERPELVARFRNAGLTQKETASTLGVSRETVKRHDEPTYRPRETKGANAPSGTEIVDAELVEDFCLNCGGDEDSCSCEHVVEVTPTEIPQSEVAPERSAAEGFPTPDSKPRTSPRKPLPDAFRDRLYDVNAKAESLHRLIADDRWATNAKKLATVKNRNELLRTRDLLEQVIDALPTEEVTA